MTSSNRPPEQLDHIAFDLEGVRLRVYGILHGITGGLNQEYLRFVKDSIHSVDGVKLAEKGMKQLYGGCGIEQELEDWLVLRRIDCISMGFQLIADPRCLWMITVDAIREKLRRRDPFIAHERKKRIELGESPYFHYMEEYARRDLIGFLPSKQAISNDLYSMAKWHRAILPKKRHTEIEHPQWRRLLLLERLMHIPCRSIHMLHFALSYAKEYGHKEVNLFVGETHNTDMHYLSQHSGEFFEGLDHERQKVMGQIIAQARRFARKPTLMNRAMLLWKKANYILFLTLGALLPPLLLYLLFTAAQKV